MTEYEKGIRIVRDQISELRKLPSVDNHLLDLADIICDFIEDRGYDKKLTTNCADVLYTLFEIMLWNGMVNAGNSNRKSLNSDDIESFLGKFGKENEKGEIQ